MFVDLNGNTHFGSVVSVGHGAVVGASVGHVEHGYGEQLLSSSESISQSVPDHWAVHLHP